MMWKQFHDQIKTKEANQMKKKVLRILAVLLIFSICTSLLPSSVFAVAVEEPVEETTPTMVDFIAGNATAEDICGVLDESIVPRSH